MSKLKILMMVAAFSAAMFGGSAIASADAPDGPVGPGDADAFLCPVVGDGVYNADANNGDNGVSAITIASGASFFPGNNQAGAHADSNSYSSEGPGTSEGPGDPGFTPIWPG